MAKLTDKQRLFIQEYLVDLNGAQAAIRAGYSKRTANRLASENLRKPHIQAALEKAMKERESRLEVTQDMVLRQLAKIAFHDIKDVVMWGEDGRVKIKAADKVDGTVLQEVSESVNESGWTKKVKLNDRMKALELLGKHLGMFTDNVNLNANVVVQIVDDIK